MPCGHVDVAQQHIAALYVTCFSLEKIFLTDIVILSVIYGKDEAGAIRGDWLSTQWLRIHDFGHY